MIKRIKEQELVKELLDFWGVDIWSKRVIYFTIISISIFIYKINEGITQGLTKVIVDIISFIIFTSFWGLYYSDLLEKNRNYVNEIKNLLKTSFESNEVEQKTNSIIRSIVRTRTNKNFVYTITIITIIFIFLKD